jgi:hypothetical protein
MRKERRGEQINQKMKGRVKERMWKGRSVKQIKKRWKESVKQRMWNRKKWLTDQQKR